MKTKPSIPRVAVPSEPSRFLRDVVGRNRRSEVVATFAVCSAHPAVLDAAIHQSIADGSPLHVESTSNQVNQFGGYTGTTPAQFVSQLRRTAEEAGLASERILIGADHLGPYCWRAQPAAEAMAKACELASHSVLAGYQKIHLDASMSCADDPCPLDESVVAERTAMLCRAAEESYELLAPGSPRPLYVIGTEVPVPGGETVEGERPEATRLEDMQLSLEAFQKAFLAHGLESAWENVIAIVVQPGVEFGDSSVFEYDRQKAWHLAAGLPETPELVYEAHSTDYQTLASLEQMVEDHFAILKVGPWLTFAFREAIFALAAIESEMPEHRHCRSRVREALETEMLRSPAHWKPYYRGNEQQQKLARAFSFSDRCRYYWPLQPVELEVGRLMHNLSGALPIALLSQYLPSEYEAIRDGSLEDAAPAIVRHHIQRVLTVYSTACGVGAR
jgi:D-tagatose-1,6-bisphosphate aldolase subunit GatZ/KbaZ